MYLLLVALGIIIFIHSLLFVFIIQKNTDLVYKIIHLEKRIYSSKSNVTRKKTSKKGIKKTDQFSSEQQTKMMKRGRR